ncbi:hypothetical protein FGG08_003670 [Glutinoglossum americanum]|uniref:Uncharacterized protein n=1 Tax=Glutinoglossum americanum TaxID=1670608 RepID=A0A9P8I253_9PEZI|nr:hypothetical protein FGG08_003670 [Glutinoglossum americanum]
MAGDSQVWKSAFYNRFVRPRVARIPGIREKDSVSSSLLFSSKVSKWLEDEALVKQGQETNWKRQYKLRHNWSTGSCNVSELQVAHRSPAPQPLLVQLREGIAVTVDDFYGLQAWSLRGKQTRIASTLLQDSSQCNSFPAALAIDAQGSSETAMAVIVGFTNGHYSIYELQMDVGVFTLVYGDAESTSSSIEAIAYSHPFLVALRRRDAPCIANRLSIYSFSASADTRTIGDMWDPPKLITSFKSDNVGPPMSISLRTSAQSILVSIAYAQPTILAGWSVGLQEVRLTPEGVITDSRLASAVGLDFTPLSPVSPQSSLASSQRTASGFGIRAPPSLNIPTSLSYTHPYLLASHPDNTLMFYLVTSTSGDLSISQGTRLWGHTSSVSGAHVGGRGKAVSVSSYGEDLRVWELEGGVSSATSRRRLAAGGKSVQVRPEKRTHLGSPGTDSLSKAISMRGRGLARTLESWSDEATLTKGLVGFDDEKVVVLREREPGSITTNHYRTLGHSFERLGNTLDLEWRTRLKYSSRLITILFHSVRDEVRMTKAVSILHLPLDKYTTHLVVNQYGLRKLGGASLLHLRRNRAPTITVAAVTALSRRRKRHAIAARNLAMSPVTAPTQILALGVSVTVVAAALSATNVARKAISPVTARLLAPAVDTVDMAATKGMVVDTVEDALPVKTATPAVVLGTWPETAPKALDRNVTIVGINMTQWPWL